MGEAVDTVAWLVWLSSLAVAQFSHVSPLISLHLAPYWPNNAESLCE